MMNSIFLLLEQIVIQSARDEELVMRFYPFLGFALEELYWAYDQRDELDKVPSWLGIFNMFQDMMSSLAKNRDEELALFSKMISEADNAIKLEYLEVSMLEKE